LIGHEVNNIRRLSGKEKEMLKIVLIGMVILIFQWLVLPIIFVKNMEDIREIDFDSRKVYLKKFNALFIIQGQVDFPTAMVRKVNGDFIIVVNDAWESASQEQQEAILAHELGHIKCGHIENSNLFYTFRRWLGMDSIVQMELEADRVAISAGHAKGLKEVLDQVSELFCEKESDCKEIFERRQQLAAAIQEN
jgi:hypothetical protein